MFPACADVEAILPLKGKVVDEYPPSTVRTKQFFDAKRTKSARQVRNTGPFRDTLLGERERAGASAARSRHESERCRSENKMTIHPALRARLRLVEGSC